MAGYSLTNKAVEDLAEIWDYTVEAWSENQADKYYRMLIDAFKELAKNPQRGKIYDILTPGLLGYKANQHIIFYRQISRDEVEIIRILHRKMDIKSKI